MENPIVEEHALGRDGEQDSHDVHNQEESTPMEESGNEETMASCSPSSPPSSSPPPPPLSISNKEVSSLIMKMVSLGYFHNQEDENIKPNTSIEEEDSNGNNNNPDDDHEMELTMELLRQERTKLISRRKYKCDQDCMIVLTSSNDKEDGDDENIFCMTREHLKKEIHSLAVKESRISLDSICDQLNVSIADVQQAVKEVIVMETPTKYKSGTDNFHNDSEEFNNQIHFIEMQNELVTDCYLNDIFQSKVVTQLYENGTICISDLSMTLFHLPLDFMVDAIDKRLISNTSDNADSGSDQTVKNLTAGWSFESDVKSIIIDGVKKITTASYEKAKKVEVKDLLMDAIEPLKLRDVIDNIDWDGNLILNYIQYLCDSNELQGDLHTDSTKKVSGAVFIPHIYEENQRKFVEELFHANGFITFEQAKERGVSTKRLKEYILAADSKAIVFQECIIYPDVVFAPLQVLLEECIEAESFLDISQHLSSDILCCKDDVSSIMTDHILNNLNAGGCLILDEEEVIYFSQPMIDNISKTLLPPLIEDFAKTRAIQIADEIENRKKQSSRNVSSNDKSKSKRTQRKAKGRMKHSRKQEPEKDNELELPKAGIIPLRTVVTKVTEEYSDLCDIQESYYNDENYDAKWENCNEIEEYEGPVYGFCRDALNSDSSLDQLCSNAVEAELEKIMKIRQESLMSKRGQGAANCRSIEKGFAVNFPSACHFLQLTAKMMMLKPQLNQEQVDALTSDLLDHCASFARRITEYCIFKAGLDTDVVFSFSEDKDDQDYFYSPVDLTQRRFSAVFLACTNEASGDWQDPLKALREMMPGDVGVELARMWVLTGGKHYDGGIKEDEDNNCTFVRPGDLSKFITHVKKSCSVMLGYPFELLDKKNKKKLMFSRQKQLTSQLQEATDAKDILELAIILLMQQTHGIAVFGNEINGVILEQLLNQNEIPSEVSNIFTEVSTLLQNNESISEDLLDKLRSCGLCKDITSYDH